jgi:hypothetical protein
VLRVEPELGWAGLKAIQSITSLPQPGFQLYCDVCSGIPNPGERETGIENTEHRGEGIPFWKNSVEAASRL